MSYLWITDYRIKSDKVYYGILLIQTLIAVALLLTEIFVDLQSGSLETFIAFAVLTSLLSFAGFLFPNSEWIKASIPLLIFVFCEYIFLVRPRTYVFMVYWFPLVPAVALIIQGLKVSQIWSLTIIVTHVLKFFYVKDSLGVDYPMDISAKSSLWSSIIFIITMLSALFFLYILLGDAYRETKQKNQELTSLQDQIQEMNSELLSANESLEKKVQFRTRELEAQNAQLKEYAFANSHLLRSPLSKIMGLADLLILDSTTSKNRELIDALKKSTDELDHVVRKINQGLESGDLPGNPSDDLV